MASVRRQQLIQDLDNYFSRLAQKQPAKLLERADSYLAIHDAIRKGSAHNLKLACSNARRDFGGKTGENRYVGILNRFDTTINAQNIKEFAKELRQHDADKRNAFILRIGTLWTQVSNYLIQLQKNLDSPGSVGFFGHKKINADVSINVDVSQEKAKIAKSLKSALEEVKDFGVEKKQAQDEKIEDIIVKKMDMAISYASNVFNVFTNWIEERPAPLPSKIEQPPEPTPIPENELFKEALTKLAAEVLACETRNAAAIKLKIATSGDLGAFITEAKNLLKQYYPALYASAKIEPLMQVEQKNRL